MKFSQIDVLRVFADDRPIMTKLSPVTASTYLAALSACSRAAKQGHETHIEMIDREGRVERTDPWLGIKHELEALALAS
jgi:hypothetical protein